MSSRFDIQVSISSDGLEGHGAAGGPATAAAAAAAATAETQEARAEPAGSSGALAPPAPVLSLGHPSAAANLLAAALEPAGDSVSLGDAASGFADSGDEDGTGGGDGGGGACARVPAATGGAAMPATIAAKLCDGSGVQP